MTNLTDTQERVLACLSLFSGSLSICGSCMIMYLILRKSKLTPYNRIMLGLSVGDIIMSSAWAIAPFLLPSTTSQRVWASGNDSTCSFAGFWAQLSFLAVWYNGILSFYYLLTIRVGVTLRTFAKRYEPWMHFVCIGYNLGTAALGYARGYYGEFELGQGCWLTDYPKGCDMDGNCFDDLIGWMFAGIPTFFVFISIAGNNLIIYHYVKYTTHRTRRSSMRARDVYYSRVRAVASQARWYVGSFIVAYIWAFAVRVIESLGVTAAAESKLYPLLLLQNFFMPLQGVLNLFVFSRPNYVRARQTFPHQSRFFAVREAWFGDNSRPTPASLDGGRRRDSRMLGSTNFPSSMNFPSSEGVFSSPSFSRERALTDEDSHEASVPVLTNVGTDTSGSSAHDHAASNSSSSLSKTPSEEVVEV